MSDTYSYEVLEPGGHARLVGNVLDRISRASANHASAVGSAAAMLGDPETASWTERTTAADGAALIESVQGNTLRWNQVNKDINTTIQVSGLTKTVTSSGGLSVHGTVAQTPNYNLLYIGANILLHRDGRKYLFKLSKDIGFSIGVSGYNLESSNYTRTFIWSNNGDTDWNGSLVAYVREGDTVNFDDVHVSVFDLTAMFGAGNEPATVAEFEALYPEPYYPYDPGSLLPVRMEGVETVAADESWSSECTIPAATYFPQGMRSAGTVRDELRADAAITRVGAVDLGTLTWSWQSTWESWYTDYIPTIAAPSGQSVLPNLTHESYDPLTYNEVTVASTTKTGVGLVWSSGTSGCRIVVKNGSTTTQPTGMLHYALATPTTTPIDPPLPLSYRVGAGGTERVMVESGTTSAPPIFVTRYPLDPADLAASIAPVDGPIAKTNHQVGDLLMLGFTLCKATQVIVTGETIEIGTNVTRTTVAAEIAALS